MTRYHLSVLIPSRNEYYLDIDLLHETVVNVLANTSNKTQCVVVLDGYTDSWPKSPLPVNDRLTVIHHRQSIGQRAATNEAARVATGEYLMKLDAHCALDENFDEKLLATFEPNWTVVPAQYNLSPSTTAVITVAIFTTKARNLIAVISATVVGGLSRSYGYLVMGVRGVMGRVGGEIR